MLLLLILEDSSRHVRFVDVDSKATARPVAQPSSSRHQTSLLSA